MAKNETDQERDTMEHVENHAEPRVYEFGFHIDPELPQEEVKRVYAGLRDVVSASGTVVAEGEPQKVQLAYTISKSDHGVRRDFDNAYFAWIAYEADGAGHDAVNEAARTAKEIVRFLDIRTEKEAALHAAEMHEIYAKMGTDGEGETAPEEAADAELDAALKEAGV